MSLPGDEVHVWRAALDVDPGSLETLEKTLALDERTRSAQFRFAKDRRHFIAARGILRDILARYLHRDPASLEFSYNAFGKPALAGESDRSRLHFNLSHSKGFALFAVAQGREVGVDVERTQTDLNWEGVARRYFSHREIAALASLPPGQRCEAFFRCWTRKEAYVKAKGGGLSIPLDQFDTSIGPASTAVLLGAEDDSGEASRWILKDLDPVPGYSAALAVAGYGWQLECWQWLAPY
jgi:4'-phosphopantetheinyl transferase